jgi:hypothetical protein
MPRLYQVTPGSSDGIHHGQGPEDRPSIETIAAVLSRVRRPTAGRESSVRRDLSDE